MASPLVSIITPTFNHEAFIGQCVGSVLDQTYQNWEQIIVDDGSTDQTGRIVKEHEHERLAYIWQEHRGIVHLADSYNKALSVAKGGLIAILEGDDYWPSDKLAKQISYFEEEDVILTYGYCRTVTPNGRFLSDITLPRDPSVRDNSPVGSMLKALAKPTGIIASQTVMIRKSAIEHIGGFVQPDYLPMVDYPTWVRLSLEGRFRGIPCILGFWRRHARSTAFRANSTTWEGFARYINEFLAASEGKVRSLGFHFDLTALALSQTIFLAELKRFEKVYNAKFHMDLADFARAREECLECLRSTPDSVVWAGALVGLLSSYLRVNLLGPLARIKRRTLFSND